MITVHNVQQRTDEWYALRVGRIGGSEAIGLTTPARMKTLVTLKAAEILTGRQEEVYETEAMRQGRERERDADVLYQQEHFMTTYDVGYVTHELYPYGGLSPDKFVGKNGAVEYKCPQPKAYVQYVVDAEKNHEWSRIPAEYRPQIGWYFFMNPNTEWLDFVLYNPDVAYKQLYPIRVMREFEGLQSELKKLENGYRLFEAELKEQLEIFKRL